VSSRPILVGKLPELHPAQREIVEHPARFKVVAAGRRFGKGDLVIIDEFARASHGKLCRFIAQSYASDGYQSAWRYAAEIASQVEGVEVHLQKRWFHFPATGGFVQFKTAEEPDSLRGEGIDYVAFDEAGTITKLQELWEQCVRPSLMDRRGGAIFIGTPQGFNYFNELAQKYRSDPEWAFFQFPTSANPLIDEGEIIALRASLPALVARQEIDAEFVQLAGALFKRQNVDVIEIEPDIAYVRSWDLAWTEKTTSDFTAGVKMGMTADGTIVVADVITGRMEWPDAVRCIANTARLDGRAVRQGIETVAAQVGALQTLLRDPMLVGHTIVPIEVHRDKLTRALPLVARSEQGKFAIVRGAWNQKFLDELCAFPEAAHDDMVDACSGGMTLLSTPTGAADPDAIRIGEAPSMRAPFIPRRITDIRPNFRR
jgi:predicted phage terminase large subunit-like protein